MKVEAFELTDDMNLENIPDWVKDCLDHPDEMHVVKIPTLVDELVKYNIFNSKAEARKMISNRGIAVFSYEGFGPQFKFENDNYKTINGDKIINFNDKKAVVTDPTILWQFIAGDVVKIGKRKFIKMV